MECIDLNSDDVTVLRRLADGLPAFASIAPTIARKALYMRGVLILPKSRSVPERRVTLAKLFALGYLRRVRETPHSTVLVPVVTPEGRRYLAELDAAARPVHSGIAANASA